MDEWKKENTICTRCGQRIKRSYVDQPVATTDGWRHEHFPEVPPGPVPVEAPTCPAVANDGTRCRLPMGHVDGRYHIGDGDYCWVSIVETAEDARPAPEVQQGEAKASEPSDDAPDLTPDCGDGGVHQPWCRHAGKPTPPPAAPAKASEPAKVPLSQAMLTDLSPVEASEAVAALEAELAFSHGYSVKQGAEIVRQAAALATAERVIESWAKQCVANGKERDEAKRALEDERSERGEAIAYHHAERDRAVAAAADAIKAAVDAANNRAADAFRRYVNHVPPEGDMDSTDFQDLLRSGAPAPGAVKP